ncbi:hypothetical protein CP533_3208, partial [Ophiocordyceps camponoti-saundersi (nom. inval.)]
NDLRPPLRRTLVALPVASASSYLGLRVPSQRIPQLANPTSHARVDDSVSSCPKAWPFPLLFELLPCRSTPIDAALLVTKLRGPELRSVTTAWIHRSRLPVKMTCPPHVSWGAETMWLFAQKLLC